MRRCEGGESLASGLEVTPVIPSNTLSCGLCARFATASGRLSVLPPYPVGRFDEQDVCRDGSENSSDITARTKISKRLGIASSLLPHDE